MIRSFLGSQAIAVTSATPTAGRVYLNEFEVLQETTVEGMIIDNVATVAGNVTVGIYGPIATEETCNAAPLKATSASTAQSGTSVPQYIAFTAASKLAPGRYYMACEFSDATATFLRYTTFVQVTGWTQYYDRGGGYGALTDPCPAPTDSQATAPGMYLRCVVT
jgi:hypothetical protein